MSTHRRIGIVCVICMAVALAVCVAVYAARANLDVEDGHSMGYESTLFDTSEVHTIDIVMDDWDDFIENCEDEEYAPCAVVVDGESFKNVAIRAKGNTLLSSVKQLDSDRYSFKIEFDQYDAGTTYHGLDKLSLNNLIQDKTFLKDYLTYRMMGAFGVDAPLASYAYITVNGEDWGLYLAVEGAEDSFLKRLYGNDTGELYKPDSMGFGGGRGNGREFDIEEVLAEQEENEDEETEGDGTASAGDAAASDGGPSQSSATQSPAKPSGDGDASGSNVAASGDNAGSGDNAAASGDAADAGDNAAASGDAANPGDNAASKGGATSGGGFPGSGFPGGGDGSGNGGPGGGGPGGMNSADVKLQYIDDDPDSYSNIFDNAKTDITSGDKARLIDSLRKLSAGEDLENVLDMEEVLRYFVVHDFVCNGDSYTGTMVHNYYLRENDGKLSMIPWDYNLAFGGFSGGDATTLVNSPIDDPVSSGFGGMMRGKREDASSEATTDAEQTEDVGADGSQQGQSSSPQEADGGEAPQSSGNGSMPQPPTDGSMPQMPGGGEMPEFSGNGDMPQMPSGGQMPDFQGGDMPQMPDGVQMPTSADGSPGFPFSTSSDSRPMVDWIFSDEAYTERYHELYREYLEGVDIQAIIDEAETLIAPYVEKDPTKFYTTEEFYKAADTLKQFCTLRAESVRGQLDGTIPSTEEGQQQDSSALVDASAITVSDMGSMNSGGGFGGPGQGEGDGQGMGGFKPPSTGGQDSENSGQPNTDGKSADDSGQPAAEGQGANGFTPPDANGGFGGFEPPGADGQGAGGFERPDGDQARPSMPSDMARARSSTSLVDNLPMILVCVVAMLAGIAFTFVFRRP